MENNTTILDGYSNLEKGAYLGAIASISTADRAASEQELQFIEALADSAGLDEQQKELIMHAASTPMADDDLRRCLDVLKTSELRFSLVSDMIAFAESDQQYSEEEQQSVKKIASYLGVNAEQFSLLDKFTKSAVQQAPAQAQALADDQTSPQGFFESLGFGDKLKSAGINSSALFKGALGILGPMMLAKMFSRGGNRTGSQGGGLLGGLLGSLAGGGLASALGGNSKNTSTGGGGLGGLLGGSGLGGLLSGGGLGGLLSGGRGLSGAGGLLGRLFK